MLFDTDKVYITVLFYNCKTFIIYSSPGFYDNIYYFLDIFFVGFIENFSTTILYARAYPPNAASAAQAPAKNHSDPQAAAAFSWT